LVVLQTSNNGSAVNVNSQAVEYAFHPLANVFPLLEGGEFVTLVEDVRTRGLNEPIVLYEGMILDGRNRYRACSAAGAAPKYREMDFASYDEARAYVISANIRRRHLTAEQGDKLIEDLLKANPEQSDRQIAQIVKRDHKTVGVVRKKVEARGEIPHVETRTDSKGRSQPAHKTPANSGETVTVNAPNAMATEAGGTTCETAKSATPTSAGHKRKFDAKGYAIVKCEHIRGLAGLCPERLDAVLGHILNEADVVAGALVELARHPKIGALIAAVTGDAGGAAPDGHVEYPCNPAVSEFFSTAGGADILDWIPADRRVEVVRGFLDELAVAGVLEAMSDEFGRQLRARLPVPKWNDAIEPAPEIAAEPNQALIDTTLPDDGSIPPFLQRTGPTDADKKAIADLKSREAERTRLKTMNRIAKLKAKQSGALSKMPVQGKDALALINANEAAS
jgi:hypothetical protein